MDFNHEMAELFDSLGMKDYKVKKLKENEKPKPSDWANLEKRIALRVHDNEVLTHIDYISTRKHIKNQ